MFAKKRFKETYLGYVNVLQNIFDGININHNWWNSMIFLSKDLLVNQNKIRITFELKKNKNKVKRIKNEIDFDYYIKNITSKKSQYDLSKLLNFKESKLDEENYIMYLNDISIKKHLNSKYSGDHILGNQAKANLLYKNYLVHGFYKKMLEGKSSAEMKEWADNMESEDYGKKIKDDFDRNFEIEKEQYELPIKEYTGNKTLYDILERPTGVVKYYFDLNTRNRKYYGASSDFPAFDIMEENPRILHGYQKKSNFILHMKILLNKDIISENYTLLSSENMNTILMTDYDTIYENIKDFLIGFEKSKEHAIISRNINTKSLINTMTSLVAENETTIKELKVENKDSNLSLGEKDYKLNSKNKLNDLRKEIEEVEKELGRLSYNSKVRKIDSSIVEKKTYNLTEKLKKLNKEFFEINKSEVERIMNEFKSKEGFDD